ncbi:class I SAM-dependent methyltransferase [Jiangella aurantiaca]|uniref:class I SAM-dependent methyltransferase n=1 Tax=Jiangella aurantiaca TaxID=2530373 RepID=UPI0013A5CEF9|nr:methyltransferase domain-containing protein [Jiangella aurantiaca]
MRSGDAPPPCEEWTRVQRLNLMEVSMMTETFDAVAFKQSQRRDWNGVAPGWRRWYDVVEDGGQAVTRTLVERAGIGPGDAVLDVATGYGEPALAAARTVGPAGWVVATDISAEMLAFGRERAAAHGLANIEFVEADAEGLSFDPGTFDAVLSRQGLQFLPDVPGTLRRLLSFLKRDGRLAAAVWGPPATVDFARPVPVVLAELGLPSPPPGRPGIFALADAGRLATLLAEAGFRDVETGSVEAVYETASPEAMTEWTKDLSAPIANLVRGQPDAVAERVWRKVTEAWAPLVTPEGRVRTRNQALWAAGTSR